MDITQLNTEALELQNMVDQINEKIQGLRSKGVRANVSLVTRNPLFPVTSPEYTIGLDITLPLPNGV